MSTVNVTETTTTVEIVDPGNSVAPVETTTTVDVTNDNVTVVSAAEQGPEGIPGTTFNKTTKQVVVKQVVAETIPLDSSAFFDYIVNGLRALQLAAGTCELTIRKNGVAITGLSALAVSTTPANPNATAGNSIAAGDSLDMVVANPAGASNLQFTLAATRSS